MAASLERASTNRCAEMNCLIQQRNGIMGRTEDGMGLESTDGTNMEVFTARMPWLYML